MLFFLIPFALYLIVFARPLNMIYCAGKFDESGVALVSEFLVYLGVLAAALRRGRVDAEELLCLARHEAL